MNPKGTSSYCPMCGEKLAPNGQWRDKVCKRCNIVWNRDLVAYLNLLKMWGVSPNAFELECGRTAMGYLNF
ncbi:zinc ribbon domain-containing protein [Archaeoglobus sp.]